MPNILERWSYIVRPRIVVQILLVTTLAAGGVFWKFRSDDAPPAEAAKPTVILAPAKQKAIWDAEHVAFELESRFGKPFLAAMAARDTSAMLAFFRDDCLVDVGAETSQITKQVGVVSESIHQFDERGADGDVEALLKSLLASLADVESLDRQRLRVLTVEESEQEPGRWETRLLITAHGVGQSGDLIQRESEHLVTFQLASEEKIPVDQIVVSWRIRTATARRSSQFLMEEVTSAYGLDRLGLPDNWHLPVERVNTYNFQMAVEDFDRDGFLDIAIASGDRRPILLRSERGERFREVAIDMGLQAWNGASALVGWIDYNNDGFPDLLMGDRFYSNQQGTGFVEVTSNSRLSIGYDPMGCVVADYDCDGWLDLYVVYQHSADRPEDVPWVGDSQSGALNRLWHNDGRGGFEDVTFEANASTGFRLSFAASWLFLDDDHFPDLYVANDFGSNMLLQNTQAGSFLNVTQEAGVGDFSTSMGVAVGDINNDGSPEIYVANMYSKMGRRIIAQIDKEDYPAGIYEQIRGSCAGNRLYSRDRATSKFHELSEHLGVNRVGWAYAPAFADLNNDGWQDLYATTGYLSFSRKKPDG